MTPQPGYVRPQLHRGMDHEHYDYNPLNSSRPVLRWPNDSRIALCVVVSLDIMEWVTPTDGYQLPTLAGGYGPSPFPDVTRWSHREYGHRVGVFRLLETLGKHGIKPAVAMDVLTAENYPFIVNHCQSLGCEVIAHGISASRMITSQMSEEEERGYIASSVERLARVTGSRARGWLGQEYGESERTPSLLADVGIGYVCDWVNDDQPYEMKAGEGSLCALPMTLPLDDVAALWERRIPMGRYVQMIKETFDALYEEGSRNGTMIALNLRPWLSGQPFRVRYLSEALGYILGHPGVWCATGSEIVDWYRTNRP